MCWVGKAGMLRKLTSTSVLTGLPMGTGAVGQSKALNPMAAGEEQNRDPKSRANNSASIIRR